MWVYVGFFVLKVRHTPRAAGSLVRVLGAVGTPASVVVTMGAFVVARTLGAGMAVGDRWVSARLCYGQLRVLVSLPWGVDLEPLCRCCVACAPLLFIPPLVMRWGGGYCVAGHFATIFPNNWGGLI